MEAHAAGSLLSFLADCPRSAQPPRPTTSPDGHPRISLLRHLRGAKSYAAIAQWGADQDIALMHQLGFTRKPPKLGGIRKVLIALNPKAFETH